MLNLAKNNGNCSVEQLIQLFYSYSEKGLETSAFTILSMLCRNASSNEEIRNTASVLDEVIFHSNNIDIITEFLKSIIKPILQEERKVPVLMFHLYGWLYGGAERALTGVTNYLIKKYKVIMVVFEPVKNTAFRLDSQISFIPIYGNSKLIDRLVLLVKLLHPDIFIGNNNSIPELVNIYPILFEAGIKTIAYNHEYYFFPHNHYELYTTVIDRSRALAKANAACFLNWFSANAYSLINNNAAVMPNLNTFQQQSENYFNPKGKTILAVGRFSDSIKRLDRILKSFKLVLSRHPDAKLLVVGPYNLNARIPPNSNETVSELLEILNFNDSQLNFMGEQVDVTEFYKISDLFVMTSENEGFAVVLTEAGSFGLPSVIFSIPGLEDIISDGINGYIVPQDDIIAMADKLSDLLDDVQLRRNMSNMSNKLSLRFSTELIGARWEKLINTILVHDENVDINNILSSELMNEVSDYPSFVKTLISEYEKISIKIASSKAERYNKLTIISSIDNSTKIFKYNIRNYGIKTTFFKLCYKIKMYILKLYYRYKRKLRFR